MTTIRKDWKNRLAGREALRARRLAAVVAASAALTPFFAAAPAAFAGTPNWTGASGTNFETPGNWTPSGPPANDLASDVATFDTGISPTPSNTTPTLSVSRSVAGLLFNAGNWTLNGGSGAGSPFTLDVGGSGITVNGGTDVINANLAVGANQTWQIATVNPFQVNGLLANDTSGNTYTLMIGASASDGPVILANSGNTFSGTTTVNGTLQFGTGAAGRDGTLTGAVALNSGSTLNFNYSAARTFSGQISGSGTINQNANNALTFSNALAGGTNVTLNVNAGSVVIDGASNTVSNLAFNGPAAAGATGVVTIPSTGTLNANFSPPSTNTNTLSVGATAGGAVLNVNGTLTANYVPLATASGGTGALNVGPTATANFGGATGPTGIPAVNNTNLNYLTVGSASGGSVSTNGNGYFSSSGTVNTPRLTGPGGNALIEITGGTVTIGTTLDLNSSTGPQMAELNLYGGTVKPLTTTANPLTLNGATPVSNSANNNLTNGYAVVNFLGGTFQPTNVNQGFSINPQNNGTTTLTTSTGILNLNSGTLFANFVRGGGGGQPFPANSLVNFNGGTLRFTGYATGEASQGSFINNACTVTVYPGGAFIDDNNTPTGLAIPVALQAPTGSGVKSITFTGGGGYATPPLVQITGGSGRGATAVAVVTNGVVTALNVTSPGTGYAPGDVLAVNFIGGNPATPASATAVNLAPNTSGGLFKLSNGTAGTGLLTLNSTAVATSATTFRTNISTYTGPTVVEAGTLALVTNAATVNGTSVPAANNNIPNSSAIVVGDTFADRGAVLQVSGIAGTGGFKLSSGQIIAGFGTVKGSNSATTGGFTISTGSIASPATYTALGTALGTAVGNAAGTTTGTLTLTSATAGTKMTTNLAGGGVYEWKLNTSAGGTAVAGSNNADVSGNFWDDILVDTVAGTATPASPFIVRAVGFPGPVTVNGSTGLPVLPTQSYSWVIARASDASITSALLPALSLDSSGLPAPAAGFGYSLSTQADPSVSGASDLVLNYAPVPEPGGLLSGLGFGAALLLRNRRRR